MRSPVFICVFALLLRILAIGMVQSWPLNQKSSFWESGPEVVNIASSLASHKGFSSPFGVESGPTAWIPPVYPSLVGVVFMLSGTRSNTSALIVLTMQAIFSALVCIPLYAIAKRAFDEKCALWATWGWALFPYAVLIPGLFVWETSLSAFLLVLLCHLSINLSRQNLWNWISVGVLWGIAALTNTAIISVMPVLLLATQWRKQQHFSYKMVATIVLVASLVAIPWVFRNWYVLGAIVPVRSNFGEELWMGSHEGGIGRIEFGLGPANNEAERERYQRMGEISYVRQKRTEAVSFISANPGRFFRQAFYRFRYWWFAGGESAPLFAFYRLLTLAAVAGIVLALPKINNATVLSIFGIIVIYPLVYYIADVYARYRYPMEPLLMLFGGFAVSRAFMTAKRKAG